VAGIGVRRGRGGFDRIEQVGSADAGGSRQRGRLLRVGAVRRAFSKAAA
jgi:hypothetical protein